MQLIAYRIWPEPAPIRSAPSTRDWMDDSRGRFAYRCLPLTIANSHGWELLCPYTVLAIWDGGHEPDAVHLTCLDDDPRAHEQPMVMSHFGEGILTFRPGYLFRTEAPYGLYVSGPINRPKPGISPLTGIVETDWLPYTFTMNWRFTGIGQAVVFERGEPFCHLFPVHAQAIERVEPELRDLAADPELMEKYQRWHASRGTFLRALSDPASEASAEGWQRHYMRGVNLEGEKATETHRTKLRVPEFKTMTEDEPV